MDGTVQKTKHGGDRYWELGKFLRHTKCPIDRNAIKNIEFLLELRHEIEHRSTTRVDDAISAKLQACCLNFNHTIKNIFGAQYGLERRLSIALQLSTFNIDQRATLKKAGNLPAHIETMMDAFHASLTDEELTDPGFAYRVAFVPKIGKRTSASDAAVEFVKAGSEEAEEINRVLLREIDKKRYTPTQVVNLMNAEGYPKFTIQKHTELWKTLGAKEQAKGFGREGDYAGTWVWYDLWIDRVRAHCQEHVAQYK